MWGTGSDDVGLIQSNKAPKFQGKPNPKTQNQAEEEGRNAVTCLFEDTLLAGSSAILCTGGLDVIRKEAWPFYRTNSGVRVSAETFEPFARCNEIYYTNV